LVLVLGMAAAACSSAGGPGLGPAAPLATPGTSMTEGEMPHILTASRPLQCVPYTRALTGLPIRGHAWTWWPAAEGHYLRSRQPRPGAVLVLRRTARLRYGHLAVVTRVINSRQVLVDHANWLNRGRIHRYAPVIDVSPSNDWSAVRVWYIPGNTLGARTYPAHGFIHPVRIAAAPGAPI
ncbi:MAG: CHAP domain-containing protein, partial [Kiloniellales bacterium]